MTPVYTGGMLAPLGWLQELGTPTNRTGIAQLMIAPQARIAFANPIHDCTTEART
jgi:hypothetical protein